MEGIKYIGPLFDGSGYAQAARGYVLALHKLGVPLTIHPVSFEKITPDLGNDGIILRNLINKKIKYDTVITHLTPEFWAGHKEEGKINIGYTVWETSLLHPDWPGYINNMDACMVACEWNIEVFRNSGVTIPIHVVPHGIDTEGFTDVKPYSVKGVKDDAYKFYSIFQFTERKHPMALIKSYWAAFQNNENVALILKTYRSNHSAEEKEAIRATLKRLKEVTPMDKYPPIYLVSNLLSRDEVLGLHKYGDCLVSLDRGEGFGLVPFEAGAMGNPIMVTGLGGALEYANKDNSYLTNYTLTPVSGMPWCMSINSLVKTDVGYVRAKDLSKECVVWNKNLNLKRINKIEFRPMLEDEEIFSLKCFSFPEEMEITSDHKLYVVDGGKIVKKKVKHINVGDYIYVPKPLRADVTRYGVAKNKEDKEKLFYLSGLYIAEGYIDKSKNCVGFSFKINEKHTLGYMCKNYMRELFGDRITNIYERDLDDRNGYEIYFCCKDAVTFFYDNFGTGSYSKFISDEIKYDNLNYKLLMGYWDGDGHIRKEGYKNKKTNKRRLSPECIAETASFDLAMDIRDVMLSLDIIPSIRKSERKDHRISYVISVSDSIFDELFKIKDDRVGSRFDIQIDSGFGVMVTKKEIIEDYSEFICSIAVEADEDEDDGTGGSYILNGVASSNSPWYRGDQLWAEPDCGQSIELFKHIYNNKEEANSKGKLLQDKISKEFTWEVVGKKMLDIIDEYTQKK